MALSPAEVTRLGSMQYRGQEPKDQTSPLPTQSKVKTQATDCLLRVSTTISQLKVTQ